MSLSPRLDAPDSNLARSPGSSARLLLILVLILLHVAVYYGVNAFNASRPAWHYWNLHTFVDGRIPYLGWTAVIYYLGDLFILLFGGAILWRLQEGFTRAIGSYVAMILMGGAGQVFFPAISPDQNQLFPLQQLVHETISGGRFANLPSMHVALTVLPAAIAWRVVESRSVKVAAAIVAALVTVSTLTTKEHYAVDAVAGVLLALACFAYWRAGSSAGNPARGGPPSQQG